MTLETNEKKACVTGAAGFMASTLVKLLLENGYFVHATVRDAENHAKVAHLLGLPGATERLKLFSGDMIVEGSLDAAVLGCDVVFHTATPVRFDSTDPQKDMIDPAVEGTLNVLKACSKSGTVRRVVITSSAAAVTLKKHYEPDMVMDETHWSDVEYLCSEKPPTWGYPVSKALAEKAAWKFAEENHIDLVTLIPVLVTGRAFCPQVPSSIKMANALLLGNGFLLEIFKGMQKISGSISLVHVEDVCRAHIFVAEEKWASGRYICCAHNTSVVELAQYLSTKFPEYQIPNKFGDFPVKSDITISSKKLLEAGFKFKHDVESMFKESVEYLKSVGELKN